MARIIIIGGHGKVALIAERLLTAAGHAVDDALRGLHAPVHLEERAGLGEVRRGLRGLIPELLEALAGVVVGARPRGDDREGALALEEVAAAVLAGHAVVAEEADEVVAELEGHAHLPPHPLEGLEELRPGPTEHRRGC